MKGEFTMPKVAITQAQKDRERIRANLLIIKGGNSNKQMSKVIGASTETFRKRLENPEKLTVDELLRICRRYRISASDLLENQLRIRGCETATDERGKN
jgi:DNA-binding Xre family transcriptional regulator